MIGQMLAYRSRAAAGSPASPVHIDASTAVLARTQLSTMVEHLTDRTWHMPGHAARPDRPGHDLALALAHRITRDLELLQ